MRVAASVAARVRPVIRSGWRWFVLRRAEDLTSSLNGRSIVVVAPHPDDETLGCGALVARLTGTGTPVSIVVVTDGRGSHPGSTMSPDALAELRTAECVEACRRLGLPDGRLHQLGIPEGSLAAHLPAVVAAVIDVVDEVGASDLLVPSALDWHVDHALVSQVGAEVVRARRAVRLLEYPVWFWADGPWIQRPGAPWPRRLWRFVADPIATARSLHPFVVPTGRPYLAAKQEALASYRSQVSNLTGEPTWATLDASFLADFLGEHEIFFAAGARP